MISGEYFYETNEDGFLSIHGPKNLETIRNVYNIPWIISARNVSITGSMQVELSFCF